MGGRGRLTRRGSTKSPTLRAASSYSGTYKGGQVAGRLQDRQAAEHAEDHSLHRQPVQERQDLAAPSETEQAGVPDRGGLGRQLQHGGQQVEDARPAGSCHHLLSTFSPRGWSAWCYQVAYSFYVRIR